MSSERKCPVCGDGTLTLFKRNRRTAHRGVRGTVKIAYSRCDTCKAEIAGIAEATANKRAMLSFRQSVEESLRKDNKTPV